MVNNYFKVHRKVEKRIVSELFYFNDRSLSEITVALRSAQQARNKVNGRLSVWKQPKLAGEWRDLEEVVAFNNSWNPLS